MKKFYSSFLLALSLLMFNTSGVLASVFVFNSTPTSQLITENSGTFTGSINYNASLWSPGNVTSAKLTLHLSDDFSTILGAYNAIDIPREWGQISNIKDGGLNLGGAPTQFEVEQTSPLFNAANVDPFDTTFSGSEGFENPLEANPITNAALFAAGTTGLGIITPSVIEFEIDVTSLLNNAGLGGNLEFDLTALNLYSFATLPPDFLTAVAPFGFDPLDPQSTFEDYVYTGAALTVSAVPEPSIYLLLIVGLIGIFLTKNRSHLLKQMRTT